MAKRPLRASAPTRSDEADPENGEAAEPGASQASDSGYDAVLTRLEVRAPQLVAREARRLRTAVSNLRRKGPFKLPSSRFPHFVALRAYRTVSWELRYDDPARMLELARLALQEAEHLDVEKELGWERSRSIAALAWAEVGNALRVNDRFDEADQAFVMALHCLRMGSPDDRLRARVFSLRSSLHADRGELLQAIADLDVAIGIYQVWRESHLEGMVSIAKGHHLITTGGLEPALEITRRGIELLDAKREPELFYAGVHNFARGLLRASRPDEAQAVLRRHRPHDLPDAKGLQLRHRWLEAEIAALKGEEEGAAKALGEIRLGLMEIGRRYDAAVVAIELASLRFRNADPEEARQLCLAASDELFRLGIDGEARTAILMLLKALETGTATLRLIQGTAGYLRQPEYREVPRVTLAAHP